MQNAKDEEQCARFANPESQLRRETYTVFAQENTEKVQAAIRCRFFAAGCLNCPTCGTIFARTLRGMRWAQFITIYLAIGAPVGVSQGLRGPHRRAWRSVAAALFWPLVAWHWLWRRDWRQIWKTAKTASNDHAVQKESGALVALAELSRAMQPLVSAVSVERLQQQTREALEKYVGLSCAVNELEPEAPPGPRDVALFRLVGHKNEECAARCVQRRNAIRLRAHHIQARQEFLRTLHLAQRTVEEALDHAGSQNAVYAVSRWNRFVDCAQQLCQLLGDAATAEATRRLAAEDFRPATPTVNNLPPQKEVTTCTPILNLPLETLPNKITSRLG